MIRILRKRIVSFLGSLILISVLVSLFALRQGRIESLRAETASLPEEFSPLRFVLLSISEQEISARLSFLSLEGKPIATLEKAWAGRTLFLEFDIVPIASRFLAFPGRISAEGGVSMKGTSLFPYYDEEGFPGIYLSARLGEGLRKGLSAAFKAVRSGRNVLGASGKTSKALVELGSCQIGAEYRTFCRSDGTVDLILESPSRGVEP